MINVKIADIVFCLKNPCPYVENICRDYITQEKAEKSIEISIKDIDFERSHSEVENCSQPFLESIAVFRKISEYVLKKKDGMLFHGSSVLVDGKAYLFTGVSGSGKSTHANLWKQMLGDKMTYINDDKPILRIVDGKIYMYGTPWMGKHNRGANTRGELDGVCKIVQSKVNSIRRLNTSESLSTIMNQTVRPENQDQMIKLLNILDRLIKGVAFYELSCDISEEASRLSYNTMVKKIRVEK